MITDKEIKAEVDRAMKHIRVACNGCDPISWQGWEIRFPDTAGYNVLVVKYNCGVGNEEYKIAI